MKIKEKSITALRIGGLTIMILNGISIIRDILSFILFRFILPNLNIEIEIRFNPVNLVTVIPLMVVFIVGLVLYLVSSSMEKNTLYIDKDIHISNTFIKASSGLLIGLFSLNKLIIYGFMVVNYAMMYSTRISYDSIMGTMLINSSINLAFSILIFITGILMFFINIKKDDNIIN